MSAIRIFRPELINAVLNKVALMYNNDIQLYDFSRFKLKENIYNKLEIKLHGKKELEFVYEISRALSSIYFENEIHRDLHLGNVLYSELDQRWYISDLGFCGPVDKSSKSIYGNLPYIAPEVIRI